MLLRNHCPGRPSRILSSPVYRTSPRKISNLNHPPLTVSRPALPQIIMGEAEVDVAPAVVPAPPASTSPSKPSPRAQKAADAEAAPCESTQGWRVFMDRRTNPLLLAAEAPAEEAPAPAAEEAPAAVEEAAPAAAEEAPGEPREGGVVVCACRDLTRSFPAAEAPAEEAPAPAAEEAPAATEEAAPAASEEAPGESTSGKSVRRRSADPTLLQLPRLPRRRPPLPRPRRLPLPPLRRLRRPRRLPLLRRPQVRREFRARTRHAQPTHNY